jgi:uncharacterized protein YndB with AHSA1/START domain
MNKATIELPSDTEMLITRWFDAPRDLVFEAMTKPEHVRVWYAHCDAMVMRSCEIDLRPGGKWRYVIAMGGAEHVWSGEYREIVVPERIVSIERYENIGPGHDMTAHITLEPHGERTLFRNRLAYQSKADRDGHLQSGMEPGMQAAFDRLEKIARRDVRSSESAPAP